MNLKTYFFEPCFNLKSYWPQILSEMPENNIYKKKADSLIQSKFSHLPEHRFPVMTREQEYHQFRKYNFLKFRYNRGDNNLNHIKELNEQLILSNTRIHLSVAHKNRLINNNNFTNKCYEDIIKGVDLFDYRRGIKFVTYIYWAHKNSVTKTRKELRKQYKISQLTKKMENGIESDENIFNFDDYDRLNKSIINLDYKRRKIIQDYYGIGTVRKRLDDISKELGFTLTRAQQLKIDALKELRIMMKKE
jgi:DNA-directed RNA polymerase sigma subunit (sigma70/sigma32)